MATDNDTDFFLPAHYVHQISDQVTRMGARLPEWFTQGIKPGVNGEIEVQDLSFESFKRLLREAIALTQEPAFGLLLGERLLIHSHGVLGYAAANSQTLQQAIDVMEQYMLLRTSLLAVRQVTEGDHLRLEFIEPQPLEDLRAPVLEAVVLTVKNLIDYISLGACRVSRAVFPFEAPTHAPLARDLFKCEVQHGASWAGLELPLAQLSQPLKTANPQAWQEALARCEDELAKLRRQQSLAATVRQLMLGKQGGFPSLQVTARLLNITPRTLHRRLQDEGTSYREILEDIRHTLAVEHLRAGRLTIQEIAFMLGYDDQANFRRAFKRWEGVPPSAYEPR